MKLCWVEVRNKKPARIFRTKRSAVQSGLDILLIPYSMAVAFIRNQVIKKADGECEQCGKPVGTNGHMHEKIPRGKGGEISLENSILLCADCHIGDNSYSAHSDRRLGGKRS